MPTSSTGSRPKDRAKPLNQLNALIGTPFASEKRQPMEATGLFLGLNRDLRSVQWFAFGLVSGSLRKWNPLSEMP